jgi:hypothetical protein
LPARTARLDRTGGAHTVGDGNGGAGDEMSEGLVQILEGNTFVVSDERGDIEVISANFM